MNLEIRTYNEVVNEIANGFFSETGDFQPAVGKANILIVYAEYFKKDDRLSEETVSALDYVDEFVKNENDFTKFEKAMADTDFFSFGAAVKDAEELVEMRKSIVARKSKVDELLVAIIEKVNAFDKNITPEELQKIIEKLKDSQPINEERIVNEYFDKQDEDKRA